MQTRARQARLLPIFLNCAKLSTHNSYRQRALTSKAVHFHYRRVFMLAWICFCDDFTRARNAEMLIPKAIAHALAQFMKRIVSKTVESLAWYRKWRHWRAALKVRGDLGRKHYSRLVSCRKLWDKMIFKRKFILDMASAATQWDNYWKRYAVSAPAGRLWSNVYFTKVCLLFLISIGLFAV